MSVACRSLASVGARRQSSAGGGFAVVFITLLVVGLVIEYFWWIAGAAVLVGRAGRRDGRAAALREGHVEVDPVVLQMDVDDQLFGADHEATEGTAGVVNRLGVRATAFVSHTHGWLTNDRRPAVGY